LENLFWARAGELVGLGRGRLLVGGRGADDRLDRLGDVLLLSPFMSMSMRSEEPVSKQRLAGDGQLDVGLLELDARAA